MISDTWKCYRSVLLGGPKTQRLESNRETGASSKGEFFGAELLVVAKRLLSTFTNRCYCFAQLQNSLSDKIADLWEGRSYDEVVKSLVLQVSELIQCERYTLAVALVDNCNIEGCLQFARSYDMLLQKPKTSMFGDDEEEVKKIVEVVK